MNAQTPLEPFVRPAILDDAEGIAKVHVKGWQEAYVGLLPQHVLDRQSVPARLRMWSGLLQEPGGSRWTFVAIDPAAGIVGFAGGVRAKPAMMIGATIFSSSISGCRRYSSSTRSRAHNSIRSSARMRMRPSKFR